jgi:hypothetical protein
VGRRQRRRPGARGDAVIGGLYADCLHTAYKALGLPLSTMIDRLPEDAQTLHAELLALLLAHDRARGFAHLSGTFTTKAIGGAEYVYFQYSDPGGRKRQFSIGRRDAAIDAIVERYREDRSLRETDVAQIARLAGLLRAAGVAVLPHAPARVLRAFADAGVFAAGGVLVGSYAFLTLGNLLGRVWAGAAWRTHDVDVAAHLRFALPAVEADVPRALDSLKMGFVPVPEFDPRHPSTSFSARGRTIRVDLITPGSEKDTAPIFLPRFKAAAAPIKYLSLVMRDAQPAAAVESNSATLVVVPAPARFALHELLVSQTRSLFQQTKSGKDQHQAALLIECLAEDRPDDLESVAADFAKSGPAVTKKLERALASVQKRWPDATEGVEIVRAALVDPDTR